MKDKSHPLFAKRKNVVILFVCSVLTLITAVYLYSHIRDRFLISQTGSKTVILGFTKEGIGIFILLIILIFTLAFGIIRIYQAEIVWRMEEDKKREERLRVFSSILGLLNRHNEWQTLIRDIMDEIASFTGYDAIGIRLKKGNDYPYCVYQGFTHDFVQQEQFLCSYDNNGNRISDSSGNPSLECLCGNIINGLSDPSKSFYTIGGNFWTNSTSLLFSSVTNDDLLTIPRGSCLSSGYESLALIPIRSGQNTVGLLQLNDKRPGRFTANLIDFFEKVASAIGVAFGRIVSEEKIVKSSEQYRTLVDNALMGIYKITLSGDILYVNSAFCKIVEYESKDYPQGNVTAYYRNPDDRDRLIRIVNDNREVKDFEMGIISYKGNLINVIINSTLEGNVITGMMMDITERKRAEKELLESKEKAEERDRLKSVFLANMSHEIRTPLNAIVGFAGLLNDPGLSPDDREKFSEIIKSRSDDLLVIIQDILDISRIESGNTVVTNEKVQLNEILENLKSDFKLKIMKAGKTSLHLACEKTLPDTRSAIMTDGNIVKQIFSNLIDNAVKFTESGIIRFGYKTPVNNHLTCYVSDTGIGISPTDHELIFEHFRQAEMDKSTKAYGGTGLGLSICKVSLTLLGGKIWVESGIGDGSTFWFTIPYEPGPAQPEKPAFKLLSQKSGKVYNWAGKKFLLVEDEEANAEFLKIILTPTKAEVICAENGKQVRQKYDQLGIFDLVLMDIRLPDANGLELTKEIKAIRPGLPVIAQTAYALTSDRNKSEEFGCDGYISKPISKSELFRIIDETMRNFYPVNNMH